ncbi:MAG: hypothetical protein EHM61_23525 [Acidobacteria bacterium]|nr:MAG: hypothetical protein EHM61_23525 [Acidobacteriota bacterium]
MPSLWRVTQIKSGDENGLKIDLVTHDLRKFITLMLKKNGYVLEQLFSPLVLLSSPADGRTGLVQQPPDRNRESRFEGFH